MNTCIICKHDKFNILLEYKKNSSVTSDNKVINKTFVLYMCKKCLQIQKKIDNDYKKNINSIYNSYESYYLNDGNEEEKIDENSKSLKRSRIILENISNIVPSTGSILDVGTGTGVFLKEFSTMHNWKLYAQDVENSNKNKLEKLKNFKKFFVFQKDEIYKNYFDFISAIHLYEHIVEPNQFIIDMKKSLKKDGLLLIQVPNIAENILDIFIYDHVLHFTKTTIYNILKKYFVYVCFPKKQIPRELTIIASDYMIDLPIEEKPFNDNIDYKLRIDTILDKLTMLDKQIAIFGTSPPALFCAAYLNFNIEFFIDENINKLNKQLYGKNILHPNDIDKNIKILFPYSKEILNNISNRYPLLTFIYMGNLA